VPVTDVRARWRLAVDLDSPLDVLLVEQARGHPQRGPSTPADSPIVSALDGIRAVMVDPTAELIVAGRTSAGTVAWLERNARCRVRSLIEERGLRASSRLAVGHGAGSKARPARPARSILGMILDRDGPEALGDRLAELGDAALIDSRVLMAHRLGVDESSWPTAESRFASDLLEVAAVDDPWLAALTGSALRAQIPIVLGGHSLVGPGVRLVARGR
jgi:hypothetical protein